MHEIDRHLAAQVSCKDIISYHYDILNKFEEECRASQKEAISTKKFTADKKQEVLEKLIVSALPVSATSATCASNFGTSPPPIDASSQWL